MTKLLQSMPILRGFCYFAGTGVIFLYIFAITFFVACLVLDERRKAAQLGRRPDWSPAPWYCITLLLVGLQCILQDPRGPRAGLVQPLDRPRSPHRPGRRHHPRPHSRPRRGRRVRLGQSPVGLRLHLVHASRLLPVQGTGPAAADWILGAEDGGWYGGVMLVTRAELSTGLQTSEA